jgi:hypothetical protein
MDVMAWLDQYGVSEPIHIAPQIMTRNLNDVINFAFPLENGSQQLKYVTFLIGMANAHGHKHVASSSIKKNNIETAPPPTVL